MKSIFELFNSSNLYVKPSIPVITFNSGGAVDIINDKSNGFLINDYNLEKLVSSVKKLIDNDKLRLEMGENGRKRVEKVFSSQNYKKKLISIYSKVIEV